MNFEKYNKEIVTKTYIYPYIIYIQILLKFVTLDSSTSKKKLSKQETHSIYGKATRPHFPPSPRLQRNRPPTLSQSQLRPHRAKTSASHAQLLKKASLQSLYQKRPRVLSSQRGIIKNMKALGPVNVSHSNTNMRGQLSPNAHVNRSLNFNIGPRARSGAKGLRTISKPPLGKKVDNQISSLKKGHQQSRAAAQDRARALRVSSSRPILRPSRTAKPNNDSKNARRGKKRHDRATVFHYEFNANTFKNFSKTLCNLGFSEFDVDVYENSQPRSGYKDSPFPNKPLTKAIAKQSSMLDLRAYDSKNPQSKMLGLASLISPPNNDNNIYKALFKANKTKKPNTRSMMLGDKKYNNRHGLFNHDSELVTRPTSRTKPVLSFEQPMETSIIINQRSKHSPGGGGSQRGVDTDNQNIQKHASGLASNKANGIPGQHALKPTNMHGKSKLSRNMSSSILPTKLTVIPEQSAEEERRSVARELKKVDLMDRAVLATGQKWFSKLQRFDISKVKDPRCSRYLILDLDETLLHCSVKPISKHAHEISLQGRKIYIHLRPYVRAFLREMRKHFNLVLYTASQKPYADKVLNFLDPTATLFCLRLYRTSCQKITNNYVLKSLDVLPNIDLSRTLVIDNSLICFFFDFDNLIPIVSYFGNSTDSALLDLTTFIKGRLLAPKVKDFRPVLKDKFGLKLLKTGFDAGSIAKAVLESQPI